jgi:hypothetical protein
MGDDGGYARRLRIARPRYARARRVPVSVRHPRTRLPHHGTATLHHNRVA